MFPSLLSRQLLRGLQEFLVTGFEASNPYFKDIIERFMQEKASMVKGPYCSFGLPFQSGSQGRSFFSSFKTPYVPHLHQEHSWKRLASNKAQRSTLVATGTGSGKTECFLYPILDHCLRERSNGIQAVLIYPMNALATDQARRIARFIATRPELSEVRAGLFIGEQEKEPKTGMTKDGVITCKKTLITNPPNILLTNFKMLDYLMIRQESSELWRRNGHNTLRYLVVDELHTFDGAQGTDLACLIRRLKGRLAIEDGTLICTGTSATLGGSAEEAIALRSYASRIFGETFDENAIIGEKRISVSAFLGNAQVDVRAHDLNQLSRQLDPERFTSQEAYIERAYDLLMGDGSGRAVAVTDPKWRCKLGRQLKSNTYVRTILYATGAIPMAYESLIQLLGSQFGPGDRPHVPALLDAICALLSWAREPAGIKEPLKQNQPLMQVRLHLWLRELRRMVCEVRPRRYEEESAPRLVFSDDVSDKKRLHLPVVQCRDCHHSAWLSVKRESEIKVSDELSAIYSHFFGEHQDTTVLVPLLEREALPEGWKGVEKNLCAACGALHKKGEVACSECGEEMMQRVFVPSLKQMRRKKGETVWTAERRCAACGAADSLQIFGAQSTNLTSVLIGQAFATPYNDDKKLLTFSDSVQDAAHRSVYFGARTWRTSIRTALAQVMAARAGAMPLTELADVLRAYWLEDGQGRMTREELVGTFMPPNLTWLEEYRTFERTGRIPDGSIDSESLEDMVLKRLAYEGAEELGLRAERGRTLVRTGCVVMGPDLGRLEKAVPLIHRGLVEELGMRQLPERAVRHFAAGLLLRLQYRGGICLPDLEAYVRNGGKAFLLNKSVFLPNYHDWSFVPRFLTNATKAGNFDSLRQRQGQSWYAFWLVRCLEEEGGLSVLDTMMEGDIWKLVLKHLCAVGLLEVREGKDHIWGLNPQALLLTTEVRELVTPHERHRLYVPADLAELLVGMRAMAKGDHGAYAVRPVRQHWLGRLYREGELSRVFPKEHTGLLDRTTRELTEKAFMERPFPWSPNLLSCTPTLEMGIDIGDLSTVVLCSVPPRGANYQQRIGRAGRRDGNSFSLTLAAGRPHDLYFYENPMDMIAGRIDTPGIFLDAVSVIQRQLVAYCLDRLVGMGEAQRMPRDLKTVLGTVQNRGTQARIIARDESDPFPYNFLAFIRGNGENLLGGFFDLFEGQFREDTKAYLRDFLSFDAEGRSPMVTFLLDRLVAVADEVGLRRKQARMLNGAIRDTEKLPEDDVRNKKLKHLQDERYGIIAILKDLEQKHLLNFLTDEGLLPNYAFPEAGVKLRSVIVMRRAEAKTPQTATFEYERPAASAISEFAPDNSFYAGGRRVRIQRVDLKLSKVEEWRLCARCNYSCLTIDAISKACPVCGDPTWSDLGQKKTMVRLRSVMAYTSDRESRFGDEKDERENRYYLRQLLVSFDEADRENAMVLEKDGRSFGLEYLRKATFREINFGAPEDTNFESKVAGKKGARPGFRICESCHQVLPRNGTGEHAPFCKDQSKVLNCLYLYRELRSEAIRLMLPSHVDQDKLDQSMAAAIQLGMRLRFGGQVDHIRITHSIEPIRDSENYRHFLVLYDTVPGGTGYLHHILGKKEALLEVFGRAYERMEACDCALDPDRDGCYRCILAYRSSRDMKAISRKVAMKELALLIGNWDRLKEVHGLSDTGAVTVFDSPLEERFPDALRRFASSGLVARQRLNVRLVPAHFEGCENGFLLEVGRRFYHMGMQPALNPLDGTSFETRPDFLIWSARSHEPFVPIAIYLDGFKYHGTPETFADDTQKRFALIQSGRFRVWNLNWDDLQMDYSKPLVRAENLFLVEGGMVDVQERLDEQFKLGCLSRVFLESALIQLLSFLNEPDEVRWQAVAFQGLFQFTGADAPRAEWAARYESEVLGMIPKGIAEVWREMEAPLAHGRLDGEGQWPKLACALGAKAFRGDPRQARAVMWLDPEACGAGSGVGGTSGAAWKAAWQRFWRAANVLQFLPAAVVMSGQQRCRVAYDRVEAVLARRSQGQGGVLSQAWERALADEADAVYREALRRLAAELEEVPEFGYELEDGRGAIIGEAEMAWVSQRVALFFEEDYADEAKRWQAQGWQARAIDEDGEWVEWLLLGNARPLPGFEDEEEQDAK